MEQVVTPNPVVKQKSQAIAAIASFFVPGLGQVYNGEGLVKGILFMVATLVGYLIFILPGFALWVYGIYNAYSVAKKMNEGLIPYKEATGISLIIHIVIYLIGLVIFAVVFILLSAIVAAFVFGMSGGSSSSDYGY